jgi:hypothetical protein
VVHYPIAAGLMGVLVAQKEIIPHKWNLSDLLARIVFWTLHKVSP